ncbi:MAG: DNA-binding transcriptional regulator OxyR [Ilumatobacteraceae bacterium]
MNLRDLEYLVAVADHRHFGRAAEACHVSQPTLSTQIKKLERDLGIELFERNPRQVLLTGAGESIIDHARAALREADTVRHLARLANDPESGSLRIGLFPTLGPYLLPHVVPEIHRRFPNLELLLVEEKTETVHQRLRSGELDVALLARPVHDDQLHGEDLFEEDFLLAVPQDHALATTAEPTSTSVLAGEQILLLEDGHCLRDQALSVCRLAGADERAGFRATSLETLRQMVAAGVGVTLLPELAVHPPAPASAGVRVIRFADPAPSRRIAMFWRRTNPYRDFLPRLAEVFRDLPAHLVRPSAPGSDPVEPSSVASDP